MPNEGGRFETSHEENVANVVEVTPKPPKDSAIGMLDDTFLQEKVELGDSLEALTKTITEMMGVKSALRKEIAKGETYVETITSKMVESGYRCQIVEQHRKIARDIHSSDIVEFCEAELRDAYP